MALNDRQRLFLAAYLADPNATEAARKAGYKQPHSTGPRMLKNPEVRAAIDARIGRAALKAERVLGLLAELAAGSIEPLLRFDGDGKWTVDLAQAKRLGALRLVRRIRPTPHGLAVEIHDPIRALELIGRHLGLWKDATPVEEDRLAELVRAIRGEPPAPGGAEAEG